MYSNISPHKAKKTHKNDTITIHCYVGQVTAKQGCDYFATTSRKASAQYVIGFDGSKGMSVPEEYRAFTSSNAANDNRAITIEVASESKPPYAVTKEAYASLIELLVDICKRNGIKKLVWSNDKTARVKHLNGCNMTVHRDFANKACPGEYLYSRMGQIAQEVNYKISEPEVDYSKVFNHQYYYNRYDDLQKVFALNRERLYQHFIEYGMKEARQGCSTFNPTAYRNNYPDLDKAFGDDWQKYYEHYINFGIKENRKAY